MFQRLQDDVKEQADVVKNLKTTDSSNKAAIKAAVKELKAKKAALEKAVAEHKAASEVHIAFRQKIESMLTSRFFYQQAFEIYGGVGGLYDYGPPGCALMENIITLWRQHFVLTESMLEISGTCVTPEIVLKTSGHVDKFTDFMVTDEKSGECYRADKLLEEFIDNLLADPLKPVAPERKDELLAIKARADDYSKEELHQVFLDLKVKPEGVKDCKLTAPYPFNLMFQTSIGPTGKHTGYMRPETAQGIFVNFTRLYGYNNNKMPFACAQIGLAFRNEIAPRAGLLRVREFKMMEIEHFCNPNDKKHPKFKNVANEVMSLLGQKQQDGKGVCLEMTIGDAVAQGIVNNETLGYFMARTQQFFVKIGIIRSKLRFRQHMQNEMAHYAQDCWDAEIESSYGWIECVGHADRSAYDLQVHSKVSKRDLSAREEFKTPKIEMRPQAKLNNKEIGKTFGRNQGPVRKFFKNATNEQLLECKAALEENKSFTIEEGVVITDAHASISMREHKIAGIKYIPSVIEPSFGLGRILYSLLEHAYTERKNSNGTLKERKDGSTEAFLSFQPVVAPTKACVLTQSNGEKYQDMATDLAGKLAEASVSYRVDDSGVSLGRKYARSDEIGTPFGIVIDIQSPSDQKVTIRDRDTTNQVRVTPTRAVELVRDMCQNRITWAQVYASEEQFGRPE